MLVQYLVRFKEPINFVDHWPIPIMDGELRVVTENEKAVALEITFSDQPLHLSPTIEESSEADVALCIEDRDMLLPSVQMHLEDALAYLQCFFDMEILIDEIDIKYIGETEEEEHQIKVKGFTSRRESFTSVIPYDLFTRAIMAAEKRSGPRLESNFVRMARTEMSHERYIDSFRYSFLLIEFVFGDGKYKTAQLKKALKKNSTFVSIVARTVNERIHPKHYRNSDTEQLLSKFPATDTVIDHLVEKRGFYFHANAKRRTTWRHLC